MLGLVSGMTILWAAKLGRALKFYLSLLTSKSKIMKIILDIQDSKLAFFHELIKNFSFVQVVKTDLEIELSTAHKSILDERLTALSNAPDSLLDWDEVAEELEKMQ